MELDHFTVERYVQAAFTTFYPNLALAAQLKIRRLL